MLNLNLTVTLSCLSDDLNYNLLRLYNYLHRDNGLYSSPYSISAHVSTLLLLHALFFCSFIEGCLEDNLTTCDQI